MVELADVVPVGHTPQLTMQGIIDGFDALRPALERAARDGAAAPLADVRLRPPLPRPGKILALHRQLLGARRRSRPGR